VKTAEGDAGRPAGPRKQRRPARKPGGSGGNRHAPAGGNGQEKRASGNGNGNRGRNR